MPELTERQSLTIQILIASAIQGRSLREQRDILVATILYLVADAIDREQDR